MASMRRERAEPWDGATRRKGLSGAAMAAILAVAAGASVLFGAPAVAQLTPGGDGIAELTEQLAPSVVDITISKSVDQPAGQAPRFPPGSPFADMFEDFFNEDGTPREAQQLGTGFIIDPSGVVVTNEHVVSGADEIEVTFKDGAKYPAELVGADKATDLAVLRIKSDTRFPAVPWGDSTEIRSGEWVIAIGNPFGFGHSVSVGVISGQGRSMESGRFGDFIQTDAAINQGNSGGPLFNLDGQVIGINTMIISPTGGSIGLGFSIPSNRAQRIIGQLLEFGEVQRGVLGVTMKPMDEDTAQKLGLDEAQGVVISAVTPGGPAAEAGIEPGDAILSFDGRPVTDIRKLQQMVESTDPGASVPLEVRRGEESLTLTVVLGVRGGPLPSEQEADSGSADLGYEVPVVGLTLDELNDANRQRYGAPDFISGVLISRVDPTSSAYERGLRAGDVLIEVAQTPVLDPVAARELIEAEHDAGKEKIVLMIARGSDVRYVEVGFFR